MRKVLVSLVVLTAASVASGAMVCEVTKNASPATGLESWTVSFKGTTSGDELAAFVGSIKGPLHQVWGYMFATWYWTPYGDSSPPDARDTRILLTDAKIGSVPGYDPGEDNPANVDEGGGIFSGVGTYLASTADTDMMFILMAPDRSLNLALFRVVMPTGETAQLTGVAGAGDEVQELLLDVTIPEPATLGLLLLGGATALLRRRRR